jgi:hypothetical protein
MHVRRSLIASGLALALLWSSAASWAFVTVGVSITLAPPALPVYVQPPIPAPGFIWVPGYWAWADGDYYWVPGTWVEPPEIGLLWTPGYWGWINGVYLWNPGYWGPHVGFYGGINYGFGYVGVGYEGGYWDRGEFRYNRAVNNIGANVRITNIYSRTVVNNISVSRVSYNGGVGGIPARATAPEIAAARERHVTFAVDQQRHEQEAFHSPQARASVNHGHPAIAATPRPAVFDGRGVVGAVASPQGRNIPERSDQLRAHANALIPRSDESPRGEPPRLPTAHTRDLTPRLGEPAHTAPPHVGGTTPRNVEPGQVPQGFASGMPAHNGLQPRIPPANEMVQRQGGPSPPQHPSAQQHPGAQPPGREGHEQPDQRHRNPQ